MQDHWGFILSMLAAYIVSKRLTPRYCIVITVIAGLLLCPLFLDFHTPQITWSLAQPVWMAPEFSMSAILRFSAAFACDQYGIAVLTRYCHD